MPYIPHTETDVSEMLETIGIQSIDELFDEIPAHLKKTKLQGLPEGVSEMTLGQEMKARAKQDTCLLSFIGAGAYEHHIPAAVWELATRGEFYTAYTPYQAEASQGSLQLIYEYQTMMASLMALAVSNASLYDGGTALAEAILMAVRLNTKKNKTQILMPTTVHPFYRDTVKSIVSQQGITLIDIPFSAESGQIDFAALQKLGIENVAALVIPQPNFFGVLEDVDQLTDWAHEQSLLAIAVVNPLAMALLKPPGSWGKEGVDIACGEGQPLGIPLASGGPYYGFLCCKKAYARQLPGRIVGRTVDLSGKQGFVLTMQAREQHIRRGKATSNICTNQGLMVTASTIYMSLLGPDGLREVALSAHEKTRLLLKELETMPQIERVFSGSFFHEIVIHFQKDVEPIVKALAQKGIQAGFILKNNYPTLDHCLLICVTETKTTEDIKQFVHHLRDTLGEKSACLA